MNVSTKTEADRKVLSFAMALSLAIGPLRSSFAGLMDKADPDTQKKVIEIPTRECEQRDLTYHDLRHRNLGDAHRVVVYLVFPADTILAQAHREATRIEQLIEETLEPRAYVTTHLESAADHDELHPDERALPTLTDDH